MAMIDLDLSFGFVRDEDDIHIAAACCGGGETFPAPMARTGGNEVIDDYWINRITDWVADHVRQCLPDLLDEEFGAEEGGNA
jgi:hypothetical protein